MTTGILDTRLHHPPPYSATTPTAFKPPLHRLFTWWLARVNHASPSIVDVPCAHGRKRGVAAGAPSHDDNLIHVVNYGPPPPTLTHMNCPHQYISKPESV